MLPNYEPELIASWFSRTLNWDGATVELRIYQLQEDSDWTLEVINSKGVSKVWETNFPSDVSAEEEFQRTLKQGGMRAFFDDDNIIPFPSN